MTTRAGWVLIAAVAACHPTPSTRERLLAQLPAHQVLIAAADGPVLSDPTFRRVIDASRSRAPASFGCVIDAALASDAVAISADRTGIVIVIATHAVVAKCPTVSRVGPDLWTATIGGATLAASRANSALDDPAWSRSRSYLLSSPLAFAAIAGGRHVIGAAQADPISAWVSIDGGSPADVDLAMAEAEAIASHWKLLHVFGKLEIAKHGSQVTARADAIEASDFAQVTADLVSILDDGRAAGSPPSLECPPPGDLVSSCNPGPRVTVSSLARALRAMTTAPLEAVVSNGDVVGLRLTADAKWLLRRGDLLVAIGSQRTVSQTELAAFVERARVRTTVSIERNGHPTVIELLE